MLLFTVFSPAIAASEDSANVLLSKHLAALGGGEAMRAILTIRSSAEIEIKGTGIKGPMESWSMRPCLSRSEISLGLFRIKEGYDGARLWVIDPNGSLQFKRDPASLEYQKTMCLIESAEYLLGGDGFRLASNGRDTVDGTAYETLSLEVEGGSRARLFLNESTFLVERMEIAAPEGRAIHIYGDYRPVNGVMFPFVVTLQIPSLGQSIETRYRTITANETIDPAQFLPPAEAARDYRFCRGASSENVPFTYRHRHIFLPARIGGRAKEILFLVDSGASMTVIDSTLASSLGLSLGGTIPGAGAGGMADFSLTRIPAFSVAGIEFSEQTAIAYPVSGLLRRFEETEIGGILGYDFLSRFTTRIDFARERISFFEPDSFSSRSEGTWLETPLYHSIFSLPAIVDGSRGNFLLDTGANSSILYGTFAERSGLDRGRRRIEIAIRGAGGEEEASLCRFDSLSFGGVTVARPVLAVVSSAKGIGVLENLAGIIGNDILERFTVTFDYRKQRVLLEKNGRFGEPFYRDRAGLQLARKEDGSIVIVGVLPGSPADGAGLRQGDIIRKVGKTRASRFGSIRAVMDLFEAKEGTAYSIDLERAGKKMHVTLTLSEYI